MSVLKIKKCAKCGAMIEVLEECKCDNCGIKCCGESMVELSQNNKEYSFEKHMPEYEVVGNFIVATVNHVMEEKHYIEYIALVGENINAKKYFRPGETAKAVFPYVRGAKLYAHCNIHQLWVKDVE